MFNGTDNCAARCQSGHVARRRGGSVVYAACRASFSFRDLPFTELTRSRVDGSSSGPNGEQYVRMSSGCGGHLRRASLHLRRHLRRAVLDGACGWRSPAAPAAGRLRQRLRRAGEPTYRTVAGGAFGGRVRWRQRDSLPAVAAAAGGRGLGEAGARAWRGGRAAAAVEPSGIVSTVGRRARWRAPRRERKRSHSTPSSRDDDGVE